MSVLVLPTRQYYVLVSGIVAHIQTSCGTCVVAISDVS